VLKPGDTFGEMALIDNFPRSAQAIANSDGALPSISKTELDKILIMDRELGYKQLWAFTKTLSKRLWETTKNWPASSPCPEGSSKNCVVPSSRPWYYALLFERLWPR
jgi:hypothetical protein